MNNRVNKAGDKRGLYERTEKILAKARVNTLARQAIQYLRSCDTRVGKYLRIHETKKYNETLDKADNEGK